MRAVNVSQLLTRIGFLQVPLTPNLPRRTPSPQNFQETNQDTVTTTRSNLLLFESRQEHDITMSEYLTTRHWDEFEESSHIPQIVMEDSLDTGEPSTEDLESPTTNENRPNSIKNQNVISLHSSM
jgi:hypothetical protein